MSLWENEVGVGKKPLRIATPVFMRGGRILQGRRDSHLNLRTRSFAYTHRGVQYVCGLQPRPPTRSTDPSASSWEKQLRSPKCRLGFVRTLVGPVSGQGDQFAVSSAAHSRITALADRSAQRPIHVPALHRAPVPSIRRQPHGQDER
jgi:hypothetical protein